MSKRNRKGEAWSDILDRMVEAIPDASVQEVCKLIWCYEKWANQMGVAGTESPHPKRLNRLPTKAWVLLLATMRGEAGKIPAFADLAFANLPKLDDSKGKVSKLLAEDPKFINRVMQYHRIIESTWRQSILAYENFIDVSGSWDDVFPNVKVLIEKRWTYHAEPDVE